MEIPKEAFDAIYQELKRKPLDKNEYRYKSGSGITQAFGLVNKRSMPPDYSRQCWLRPYLFKLLLEFGDQYVPREVAWNAITVNQNYKADKHRDKNNKGNSFLVAFGDYHKGRLLIHEGDLSGAHNIQYRPIVTDFSKVLHSVEDFDGERFSLVYYTFAKKGVVPELPPCSVREENGEYFFYRGEQKITKKNGLPHPLRGRSKKSFIEAPPNSAFEVKFD
jgi:hypothetical protein